MAFQELCKSFGGLRDYMRDFFVYGYKTRAGYKEKSTRTYDNERRRIESYLSPYIRSEYGPGGKRVYLSVDSSCIPENPLYQAYRCKSFTTNDILLHFFLLDALEDGSQKTVVELTELASQRANRIFDTQTVRNKLREYDRMGIVWQEKRGKAAYYAKIFRTAEQLFSNRDKARDFLSFFGETAPFSVVGNILLRRLELTNRYLRFKHHFLAPTLDDGILLSLTQAIRENRRIELENLSRKSGNYTQITGFPVTVLVSVWTGRRYLILYGEKRRRFHSFRLDFIQSVTLLEPEPDAQNLIQCGKELLTQVWGVAVPSRQRLEKFAMTLFIDEKRESYVLQRLKREGRGGIVEKVEENVFRYTANVTDTGEMMGWVKTFTGRILSLEGDNRGAIARFYEDMRRMQRLYGGQ